MHGVSQLFGGTCPGCPQSLGLWYNVPGTSFSNSFGYYKVYMKASSNLSILHKIVKAHPIHMPGLGLCKLSLCMCVTIAYPSYNQTTHKPIYISIHVYENFLTLSYSDSIL